MPKIEILEKVLYCKKRERSKLYKLRSAHTVETREYRILDSRGGLRTSVTLGTRAVQI